MQISFIVSAAIALCIIIIIIVLFIVLGKQDSANTQVEDATSLNPFTNKSPSGTLKEGFFVKMLNQDECLAMIKSSSFFLSDNCSTQKTCGSFNFINNQTAPVVFLQVSDSYFPSGVGLLFDSSLASIVTNFSLVDSRAIYRTICSDGINYNFGEKNTCTNLFPSDCEGVDDPATCKILNSGGSVSFNAPPCSGDSNNCTCKGCSTPQLCADDSDQFVSYNNNNSSAAFADVQCKYAPSQFNKWMDDLHKLYSHAMSDNSHVNIKTPFSNEFNVYINPNTTSGEYMSQNAVFNSSLCAVLFSERDWGELGGSDTDANKANFTPKESAKALAWNLTKILGRSIPIVKADILPSNIGKSARTSAEVIYSLNRALDGDYKLEDVFRLA
jgi:hypothetical protein